MAKGSVNKIVEMITSKITNQLLCSGGNDVGLQDSYGVLPQDASCKSSSTGTADCHKGANNKSAFLEINCSTVVDLLASATFLQILLRMIGKGNNILQCFNSFSWQRSQMHIAIIYFLVYFD